MLDELESLFATTRAGPANRPLELISTPTLLDKPVAPDKYRIIGLSLLGGMVIGCGAGWYEIAGVGWCSATTSCARHCRARSWNA